jgi:hypothetical protein
MRACGRKFGVNTRPQIFLAQNLIFFNGSTAFHFLQPLSDFPQRLSTFQEIQENLSMAASIRKIAIQSSYFNQNRNNPAKIIGGKNTKDHYPSFVFSAPSFVILAN